MDRLRIALFSPVAPVKSGVSRYTAQLVPFLAQHFEIDLYVDGYQPTSTEIKTYCAVYHRREFEWRNRLNPYSLNMYHIGNNICHQYIYPVLFRYPGVVVLHDLNLHRARAFALLKSKQVGEYVEEMAYCHGEPGEKAAWVIAGGFDGDILYDRFPLLHLPCQAASGIIVHNRYSRELVENIPGTPPVKIIPAPSPNVDLPDRTGARRRLGIPESEFIVASFGFIAHGKDLECAVKAFHRFRRKHPACRYVLVGSPLEETYVERLFRDIPEETKRKITVTGYVKETLYRDYLSAADVCINMRYPTQGESSSTLLAAMGAGKPVLIPWYRQFREIPRNACVHIDLSPAPETAIYLALSALVSDRDRAEAIGRNAAEYVRKNHSTRDWAAQIIRFMKKTAARTREIEPLAYRTELLQAWRMPVSEHVASCLYQWKTASENEIIAGLTAEIVRGLGIDG